MPISTDLQIQKVKDLTVIEERNNSPSFVWQGNTYNFVPSIAEITRELETGGFQIIKLLTATVRLYSVSWDDNECCDILTPVFPNGAPQSQQIITYDLDGTNYRIKSVKPDKTGAYIRLIAHSTNAGF